jgi:hypothetical protein
MISQRTALWLAAGLVVFVVVVLAVSFRRLAQDNPDTYPNSGVPIERETAGRSTELVRCRL